MPDLPLDEKALKIAIAKAVEISEGTDGEIANILEYGSLEEFTTREVVSTYLREAGFGLERQRDFQHIPRVNADGGFEVVARCERSEQRLVGPWLPIQEEEKE